MKVYFCYPEGKAKALTLSYDDGKMQDRRLLKIMNENGIRGTFNLNYGLLGSETRLPGPELKEVYQGHEVASHTLTHPTLTREPLTLVTEEVLEDRKGLEKIMGVPVTGFAYPNGEYNDAIKDLLEKLGISYARTVLSTFDFALPEDFYEWNPTCRHRDPNLMELAEKFVNFKKDQYIKLFYLWGHSYEFDNDDNWNVIEEFCEYVGGREDIWYATNGEIVAYLKAARSLVYFADGTGVFNPSALPVWLQIDRGRIVCAKPGEQTNLI